jgi:hypothetical protein
MFNITKHSLAIYTRARAFLNVLDVNGQVINDITKIILLVFLRLL